MDILARNFTHEASKLLKIVLFTRPKSNTDPTYQKVGESYKKFFQTYSTEQWTSENVVFVRKNIKKFNLTFKTNNDNSPLDIGGDQTVLQRNILNYSVCNGMSDGDINDMMNYFIKYPITLFDNIPIEYILAQGPNQEITWKQMQIIFCQTQISLCFPSPNDDDNKTSIKKNLSERYQTRLDTVRNELLANKLYNDINEKMEADKKFNKKFRPAKMNGDKIKAAKDEIISKFSGKGIKSGDPVFKMIDKITQQLDNFDGSEPGEMVQQIMEIAENVSNDLKNEVSGDQEEYKDSINAVKNIFTEALNDPNTEEVPEDFKNIANIFFGAQNSANEPMSNDQLIQTLETLIANNNLDRSDFYKNIVNGQGQIDVALLNKYLVKMKINPFSINIPAQQAQMDDQTQNTLENIITSNNLDRNDFYNNVLTPQGNVDLASLDQYMAKLNMK